MPKSEMPTIYQLVLVDRLVLVDSLPRRVGHTTTVSYHTSRHTAARRGCTEVIRLAGPMAMTQYSDWFPAFMTLYQHEDYQAAMHLRNEAAKKVNGLLWGVYKVKVEE